MSFPEFFDRVPSITLQDSLAQFLGVNADGRMEYRYADAVRLAGHSCPTVASAYMMTCKALKALYGQAVPERGGVRVQFADPMGEGVTGVIGSVVGLLTGAAGEGGFKGLAGRFSRRELMRFGEQMPGETRFTRMDTGAAVDVQVDMSHIPPSPEMSMLLRKVLSGAGSEADAREFARHWQDRVRRILVDHWDDARVVTIRPV